MATEIVKQTGDGNLFVFARDPAEMTKAQDAMIAWSERRLEQKKSELRDFEQNFTIAKKNKWRTSTLEAAVRRAKKKIVFYEKVRDALKEGYYIIPDMDMDVFAIRTTAKNPRKNVSSVNGNWTPSVKDQVSDHTTTGKGRYVSPNDGVFDGSESEKVGADGKTSKSVTRWWEEFTGPDFPFAFAKPEVLEATSKAMKAKIFDEIGVLPRVRGADPMVVGRVTYQQGWRRKSVNFLIAWFLQTDDI
jgi:hypothetical protein